MDGGGAAAPRISPIPQQYSAGGTAFTLDMSSYVVSAAPSTYVVTGGGGSFTGSVYSHSFDTLGTYTVEFQVTDFRNQKKSGSFQVKVTSSELAYVKIGQGFKIYDTKTGHLSGQLIHDDGRSKNLKTVLSDGAFVLEVEQSGNKDLWLYDPNVPSLTVLAETAKDDVYQAKTSGNLVFYRSGSANEYALYSYDKLRDFTRGVTSGIGSGNDTRSENHPTINSKDWVLFEASLNQGPADIWSWDISKSKAAMVSDASVAESVVASLADGSFILTRIGAGGETDLYKWSRSGGFVEIGADLDTATAFTESKTYAGASSNGDVVFTTTDGTDTDLYVWKASTGQTKSISKTANDEQFCGIQSDGDVVYQITAGGNVSLYLYDLSAESSTIAFAGTGHADSSFKKVLSDDKIVFAATAGDLKIMAETGLGAAVDVGAGSGEQFQGQTSGGDFVVSVGAGSADLYLWDASAGNVVAIATAGTSNTYGGFTSDARILFVNYDGSNYDLNIWDPTGNTTTAIIEDSASSISVAAVETVTVP